MADTDLHEGSEGRVFELPDDFIGKEDKSRLESFGAHLIEHGAASRWRWHRRQGIDVAFEVYGDGRGQTRLLAIKRDRARDLFYLTDPTDKRVDSGTLEHIMTLADKMARALSGNWAG